MKDNQDERLIIQPTNRLTSWESTGIPCYYARFETAAPTRQDGPPVNEMYIAHPDIKTRGAKYLVDSLTYTDHGLIVRAHGKTFIIKIGNGYVRPL